MAPYLTPREGTGQEIDFIINANYLINPAYVMKLPLKTPWHGVLRASRLANTQCTWRLVHPKFMGIEVLLLGLHGNLPWAQFHLAVHLNPL